MRAMSLLWMCAALIASCSNRGNQAMDASAGQNGAAGSAGSAATGGMTGASGAGSTSTTQGGRGGSGGTAGGAGKGGAGGRTAAAGAGGAGGRMATAGTGGDACPPECLRAYSCAASCDATPFNNGCCACPTGTIDVITCPAKSGSGGSGGSGGYCTLPCTGAAPSQTVVQACQSFMTSAECMAYTSTELPNHCVWQVGPKQPCLVP